LNELNMLFLLASWLKALTEAMVFERQLAVCRSEGRGRLRPLASRRTLTPNLLSGGSF